MSNSEACLEFRGVSMEFPGVKALDDVSFTVNEGEIHALMGANGAGKSTLIKVLARVHEQTSGEVFLNGESLRGTTPQNIRSKGIDFIFQELELVPGFTVAQNILIGIEPKKRTGLIDWGKMRSEAQQALDSFMPGLIDASKPISSLSAAEQQIVCIVRALYRNPKILVLDEPTSRLSAAETEALFAAIRSLRERRNITIVYISHRLEELFQICDRVTILKDGKYTGTWPLSSMTREEIVYRMVGKVERPAGAAQQSGTAKERASALKVEGLNIPGLISDVSFEVHEGEILALTGAVGARKTEIIEAIMGIREGASGKVSLHGSEVKLQGARSAKKHGVCLVPENRRRDGVIADFSIKENTSYAFLHNFISHVGMISRRKEKSKAAELCTALQVKAPGVDTKTKNLSGGNMQKVVVAKWLAGNSSVYFFDEPTVGIDVRGKQEIYGIMRDLASQGKAIVMATSEIDEALEVSDSMAVLYNGRIVDALPTCEAIRERVVYLTMGGKK